MSIPVTVAEFATACTSRTHGDIYELFEYEIAQELRDEIYLTSRGYEQDWNAINKISIAQH